MMLSHRGYTLIELVLAMGIIVLTAGLVFAVMAPAQDKAREATCISNLHQIGLAVSMYRSDYEGVDPEIGRGVTYFQAGLPGIKQLKSMFHTYIKDQKVLKCPSYHDHFPINTLLTTYAWSPGPDELESKGNRF